MTQLLNAPTAFREEMIDGYVDAYDRYVRRIPGASGVAALHAPEQGKVAVVIGGGSGHYPAFYGLVGRGFASAAVIGDIFTSPSGEHAYRVARDVEGGSGVLFSFGNYSGDVMHFGMAESRLKTEGIPASTVLVTDDVMSASPKDTNLRRGIAGGFFVFKVAGASAARGDALPTVEALAQHANARTRTVGVAFSGCTVPGQAEPLFTVPSGKMAIGLGIHGEPGIDIAAMLPARDIGKLMVDALLADAPPTGGQRVAVLVNGLGGTKYEELFVLYHGISTLLKGAGIQPVNPHIGEFVTSLDMAGCSLTLCWLDEELEELLNASTVTPAFTHIGVDWNTSDLPANARQPDGRNEPNTSVSSDSSDAIPGGSAGRIARACLQSMLSAVLEHEDELGRLDAAAGDGDHGAGMVRGFRGAIEVVEDSDITARETLIRAGSAFMEAAGGASGALIGACLSAIGSALPEDDAHVDNQDVCEALVAGLSAVQDLGQAVPGDKTMIDALDPFVASLQQEMRGGASLADAWGAALPAAESGMHATTEMIGKKGRSARLGVRSRGHQDAGATSTFYLLKAAADVLRTVD